MPVTISDVAKAAGVSIKTVSRVVNNEHNVSEKTRQKVLSAVEALGYTPNPSAQSLARGYTGEVGLLVYNVADTYMMEVLHGLLDVTEKMSYRVTVSRCDIQQPDDVTRIIRMASQRLVEGFIFTPPCDNSVELIEALQRINFPFVKLSPRERSHHSAWVGTSDEQGCFEATSYLLELGHRIIGFIQGDVDHLGSWHRLEGFRRALRTYGLEPDPELMLQGDWTFDSGVRYRRTAPHRRCRRQ
jgi:LacI family transcriptional regulator